MEKIDWKRKLASRKFWALVAAFVTSIVLVAQGDATVTVGAIILDIGAVVAFVLGESAVDAASVASETRRTIVAEVSTEQADSTCEGEAE